jgi:hypothetical protein
MTTRQGKQEKPGKIQPRRQSEGIDKRLFRNCGWSTDCFPEAPGAKSPLHASNCDIPHLAREHMLRFSAQEAVSATVGSGDSIL